MQCIYTAKCSRFGCKVTWKQLHLGMALDATLELKNVNERLKSEVAELTSAVTSLQISWAIHDEEFKEGGDYARFPSFYSNLKGYHAR